MAKHGIRRNIFFNNRLIFCNFYFLIIALIGVLFFTGCNRIQESKKNHSNDEKTELEANNQDLQQQESQDYPFESESIEDDFPKDTCGDSLPQERRSYPVEFYPVYIEYSEEKLKIVKSNFCKDAFVKDVDDSKVIQVASFTEKTGMFDNGWDFLQLLKNKLDKVYKGQSKVISENPSLKQNNDLNIATTDVSEPIYKSAKLNQKQVEQLLSMPQIKLRKLIDDSEEIIKFTLGVLVPTYLPDGFSIDEFNVSDNSYYIFYQNSNNQCFVLEGFPVPAIGDEPTGFDTVEVQSPILGRVALEYTDTDWIDGSSYVGNPGPYFTNGNFHAYTFKSPGSRLFDSPKYEQKCNSISVQEAVKVVESLRYLNP